MQQKHDVIEQAVEAFYSSLSDCEVIEQVEWAEFAWCEFSSRTDVSS
jgi:hypothetical protein